MESFDDFKNENGRAKSDFRSRKNVIVDKMIDILKRDHVGKANRICAEALAKKVNEELGLYDGGSIIPASDHYIRSCVRLVRVSNEFAFIQSSNRGYYVDYSFQASYDSVRFVVAGISQRVDTVINMLDMMSEKYGPDSIPADLRLWLDKYKELNDIEEGEEDD